MVTYLGLPFLLSMFACSTEAYARYFRDQQSKAAKPRRCLVLPAVTARQSGLSRTPTSAQHRLAGVECGVLGVNKVSD